MKPKALRTFALITALALSFVIVGSARAERYSIRNLTFGGTWGSVVMSNGNRIVGGMETATGALHGFLWDGTGLIDLTPSCQTFCFGTSVDDAGRVLIQDSDFQTGLTAFSLWSPLSGSVQVIAPTDTVIFADMTRSGLVLGQAFDAQSGHNRAFYYTPAEGMVFIGPADHDTSPFGANSSGEILLRVYEPAWMTHQLILWSTTKPSILLPFSSDYLDPVGFNDRGEVIANTLDFATGIYRCWFWSAARGPVQIGTSNVSVQRFNQSSRAVGYTWDADGNHVFVWTPDEGMQFIGFNGPLVRPTHIDDANRVFLADTNDFGDTAYCWTSATGVVRLGPEGARSSQIGPENASGLVVGTYSSDAPDWVYSGHAFTWNPAEGSKDLMSSVDGLPSGVELILPTAVTDDGTLVVGSQSAMYLLTPQSAGQRAAVVADIAFSANPVAVGTAVTTSAAFTDENTADTHTAAWSWGDGTVAEPATLTEANGSGTATGVHTFSEAGIYHVGIEVTDSSGNSTQISRDIVVYDPSAGFVTGGGWIQSPAGAYAPDRNLSGPATFGFVSKYQKGATVPAGTTEFRFHAAKFNFFSDSYEWLVIAGPRAQYKGTGSVNGKPGYKFMLTAIDGDVSGGGGRDRFRIRVWHHDATSDQDIVDYDNQLDSSTEGSTAEGTLLSGGSITIHSAK